MQQHYIVYIQLDGPIQGDVEDVVTECMEGNGFTRECRIGTTFVLLAPWLYCGESTAEEEVVTHFLRTSLRQKIALELHVFVLHAAHARFASAPGWLANVSVVYPCLH